MPRRPILPHLLLLALAAAPPVAAQDHQHGATPRAGAAPQPDTLESRISGRDPRSPGQAAYAAIAEIVARLDADATTDWSMVDLEALRQHLIDMDNVTLRSRIVTSEIPGGFAAELTGEGEVVGSIRRMTRAHAATLSREGDLRATVSEVPGGVRMAVIAGDGTNPRAVARLRGLGAIGVMTLGSHHGPHHERLARGAMAH